MHKLLNVPARSLTLLHGGLLPTQTQTDRKTSLADLIYRLGLQPQAQITGCDNQQATHTSKSLRTLCDPLDQTRSSEHTTHKEREYWRYTRFKSLHSLTAHLTTVTALNNVL